MQHRRTRFPLLLILLLLLPLALIVWTVHRQVRQNTPDWALIAAVKREDVSAVRVLLAQVDDPLYSAVLHRQRARVRSLLANGADPNAVIELWEREGVGFDTPLLCAIRTGDFSLVQTLFSSRHIRVRVNFFPRSMSRTPLQEAVETKCLSIVRLLLRHGADPNGRDAEYFLTPLMISSNNPNLAIARLLCAKGAQVNPRDSSHGTPLLCAAGSGNIALLRFLLSRGAVMTVEDKEGNTPLIAATRYGQLAAVRLLIARGANPNVVPQGGSGRTALCRMIAPYDTIFADKRDAVLRQRRRQILVALLGGGADPNVRLSDGTTALMTAAGGDEAETVQLLLAHGADVSLKDKDGRTALSLALAREASSPTPDQKEIVRLLQSAEAKQHLR